MRQIISKKISKVRNDVQGYGCCYYGCQSTCFGTCGSNCTSGCGYSCTRACVGNNMTSTPC